MFTNMCTVKRVIFTLKIFCSPFYTIQNLSLTSQDTFVFLLKKIVIKNFTKMQKFSHWCWGGGVKIKWARMNIFLYTVYKKINCAPFRGAGSSLHPRWTPTLRLWWWCPWWFPRRAGRRGREPWRWGSRSVIRSGQRSIISSYHFVKLFSFSYIYFVGFPFFKLSELTLDSYIWKVT